MWWDGFITIANGPAHCLVTRDGAYYNSESLSVELVRRVPCPSLILALHSLFPSSVAAVKVEQLSNESEFLHKNVFILSLTCYKQNYYWSVL